MIAGPGMDGESGGFLTSAERMRAEFDRSFAEPVKAAAANTRDFVLVTAGGQQWALALEGLDGIEHGRTLVPVPSGHAALLGLAGVRSVAVPIFDLALLAGIGGKAGAGQAPVFALLEAGAGQRVGVAFTRVLQFARVGQESILQPAGKHAGRAMLRHEEELYTMIEAGELLGQILRPGSAAPMPAPNGLRDASPTLRNETGRDEKVRDETVRGDTTR